MTRKHVLYSELSLSSRSQAASHAPDASPEKVLAIVCVGIVLANLDLFIVNVALPTIAANFPVTSPYRVIRLKFYLSIMPSIAADPAGLGGPAGAGTFDTMTSGAGGR